MLWWVWLCLSWITLIDELLHEYICRWIILWITLLMNYYMKVCIHVDDYMMMQLNDEYSWDYSVEVVKFSMSYVVVESMHTHKVGGLMPCWMLDHSYHVESLCSIKLGDWCPVECLIIHTTLRAHAL